jgi:hypothetical protein
MGVQPMDMLDSCPLEFSIFFCNRILHDTDPLPACHEKIATRNTHLSCFQSLPTRLQSLSPAACRNAADTLDSKSDDSFLMNF